MLLVSCGEFVVTSMRETHTPPLQQDEKKGATPVQAKLRKYEKKWEERLEWGEYDEKDTFGIWDTDGEVEEATEIGRRLSAICNNERLTEIFEKRIAKISRIVDVKETIKGAY